MPRTLALLAAVGTIVLAAAPVAAIDLNPLSMMKDAVEAAVEDRSAGDIATDTEIKTKIYANVIDKMGSDVIAIDADVYEQTVMLTGIVETAEQKTEAGRLVRAIQGVRQLHNDIFVRTDVQKHKGAVENFVDDEVIEGKINALLLDAKGVNVTNFRWRSVEGHVFLFGRALSAAERDKAARIVHGIKDVTGVTSRVFVRPKS